MSHPNRFSKFSVGLSDPATRASAVTPDDDVNLQEPTRAVYVGSAGALAVITLDGEDSVTFVAVPAGTLLPIRVRRILATGTTAGSIIGLS